MKYFNLIFILLVACTSGKRITEEKETIVLNAPGSGQELELEFQKGKYFNHPSFAIWVENTDGEYIETLFVTRFVAKGKFKHGELESGKWDNKPGEVRRPATLPFWAHKRGIKAPDGLFIPSPETQVPDALTGATPIGNVRIKTGLKAMHDKKFRLLVEVNQPWDSNSYWTNSKFPGDMDYATSLQPALVYAVTIDPENPDDEYFLNPIGHSNPSGENGKLYTDTSTLTTAKEIFSKIIVRIR